MPVQIPRVRHQLDSTIFSLAPSELVGEKHTQHGGFIYGFLQFLRDFSVILCSPQEF